jgi:hypothetical protein
MPWSGDNQAYLDSLYVKRAALVGLRGNAFSDQSTQWDLESLDREIARVERVLATAARGSTTRYAATSKGC